MIRFFFLFLLMFSNEVIASVTGKTLICDDNTRGYHFISKTKVNALSINLEELKIITHDHFYELTDHLIFIKRLSNLKSKPIGWIFRRSLDYVQLENINGDYNQKFLWSCQITEFHKLKLELNNKLKKIIHNRSD